MYSTREAPSSSRTNSAIRLWIRLSISFSSRDAGVRALSIKRGGGGLLLPPVSREAVPSVHTPIIGLIGSRRCELHLIFGARVITGGAALAEPGSASTLARMDREHAGK